MAKLKAVSLHIWMDYILSVGSLSLFLRVCYVTGGRFFIVAHSVENLEIRYDETMKNKIRSPEFSEAKV